MANTAKWLESSASRTKDRGASVAPESLAAVVTLTPAPGGHRGRRAISPASGIALEVLGHAIEYLADEYAFHSGSIPSIHIHDPQIEAMRLLMAANREVYYACPLVPPFWSRVRRRLLGRKATAQPLRAIE